MKQGIKVLFWILLFVLLTLITQIGGLVLVFSLLLARKWKAKFRSKTLMVFLILYFISTFVVVPLLAPIFGREKVNHSEIIKPATVFTLILNRNYVCPDLNILLANTEKELVDTNIKLIYLDANFPFINRFPLLPHLSHNDGRKIDLCFVYEDEDGSIIGKPKSRTGYGVFVEPESGEESQNSKCKKQGFYQYDFPKYLSFGEINSSLEFSIQGTRKLIMALLKNKELEKLFIEPHLKRSMGLKDSRIRYQGCHSVRHDDHIHIQI